MPFLKQNQSRVNCIKDNNAFFFSTQIPAVEIFTNHTNYNENIPINLIKRDPLYIAIPMTILYTFILVTGIVGNVITCVVILKNKYLHTTTNYYLFSLAISDLLLLIFGLPQEMYYIWSRYPYIFGETFCVLRGLMAETSTNASVLTILAFTVERYIAICHPFLAHAISDLSRVIKFILAIWVLAILFAIPQAMQFGLVSYGNEDLIICSLKRILIPHSFELSTLFIFALPMLAITLLYIRIGIKLKRSTRLKPRRVSRHILNATHQQNSSRSLLANGQPSRKVLKMLVAVVITFFGCWAPFHIQRIVAMHVQTPQNQIYDIVTYISALFYYTSSIVNPILYHTMSHKFRTAFKETANSLFHNRCKSQNLVETDWRNRRPSAVSKTSDKFKKMPLENSPVQYHSARTEEVKREYVNVKVDTQQNKC